MRIPLIAALLACPSWALAAEVVWLDSPEPRSASVVASAAGAKGQPLGVLDLRAAASEPGPVDKAAWSRLDRTLEEVRAFEAKLDGELVIARDLAEPIAAITLLSSQAERARLRRALAYQGFAVHRLTGGDLSDPEAESYAVDLGDARFLKPWVDAVALDPAHVISAYDIAEAPERVAYGTHAQALTQVLPATIRAQDLPADSELWLNGAPAELPDTGLLRVSPGRHLLHLVEQGRVVERWVVDIGAGSVADVQLQSRHSDWVAALEGLRSGPTPALLVPAVQAMGGEVWVARRGEASPVVFKLTEKRVEERLITLDPPKSSGDTPSDGLFLRGSLGVGWMWSGDFLASHPGAPSTYGTVNAVMPEASAELSLRRGLLALDVGSSIWVPLGQHHTALTGTTELRPRPMPYVAVGVPYAQVIAGYLFPHHPIAGLRAELPLGETALSLRAEGRIGPALQWTPDFRSHAVRSAGISIVGRGRLR